MKALLSMLAILGLLAIPAGWVLLEGIDFGIDSSHPLGTFSAMDSYLVEKKLKKATIEIDTPDFFDATSHAATKDHTWYEYWDGAHQEVVRHKVMIAVDGAGKVKALGGRFYSRSGGYSDAGTRAEKFLAQYFAAVSRNKDIKFQKELEPGADLSEFKFVSFQRGGLKGYWKKIPSTGDVRHTNTISDHIMIWMP